MICQKSRNEHEHSIFYLLKKGMGTSPLFFKVFHRYASILFTRFSFESDRKVVEIADLLNEKNLFISDSNLRNLLISYASRRLFLDSKCAFILFRSLYIGGETVHRLEVYKVFIACLCMRIKKPVHAEIETFQVLSKAIGVLDSEGEYFSLDHSKSAYEALGDCLTKALEKMNPDLLFERPFSNLNLFRKSIIVQAKGNKSINKQDRVFGVLKSFRHAINIQKPDAVRSEGNGLIKLMKSHPFQTRLREHNELICSILNRLILQSGPAHYDFVEELARCAGECGAISLRQKEQMDSVLLRKYYYLAYEGKKETFSYLIEKLAKKALFQSDKPDSQIFRSGVRGKVETYFTGKALLSRINEFPLPMVILTTTRINILLEKKIWPSLHAISCHYVMRAPDGCSEGMFKSFLDRYHKYTAYTPEMQNQIREMSRYLCRHRLFPEMNSTLYCTLSNLASLLLEKPGYESLGEEIHQLIPELKGNAGIDLQESLYRRFLTLSSSFCKRKEYDNLIKLGTVVEREFRGSIYTHFYFRHLFDQWAEVHHEMLNKIAGAEIQEIKHCIHQFKYYLPFYNSRYLEKTQVIEAIIQKIWKEKKEYPGDSLFIEGWELLDLLNRDSASNPLKSMAMRTLYLLEIAFMQSFLESKTIMRNIEILVIASKHLRVIVELTNFANEMHGTLLVDFYAMLVGFFCETSLTCLKSNEFIWFVDRHFLHLFKLPITLEGKTRLLTLLFNVSTRTAAIPVILERLLPAYLVAQRGKKSATVERMKKLADNPVAVLGILQDSLKSKGPAGMNLLNVLGNKVFEEVLALIRSLDISELKSLIYTNDLPLISREVPVFNEKFQSIRHTGFLISIFILEKYKQLLIVVSDSKEGLNKNQKNNIKSAASNISELSTQLFDRGDFFKDLKKRLHNIVNDI